MNNQALQQPATKADFCDLKIEFKEEINDLKDKMTKRDIEVDKKFDNLSDQIQKSQDENLKSNDQLIQRLDKYLPEHESIKVNYKRLDQRVDNLEDFAQKAAPKVKLKFEAAAVH